MWVPTFARFDPHFLLENVRSAFVGPVSRRSEPVPTLRRMRWDGKRRDSMGRRPAAKDHPIFTLPVGFTVRIARIGVSTCERLHRMK